MDRKIAGYRAAEAATLRDRPYSTQVEARLYRRRAARTSFALLLAALLATPPGLLRAQDALPADAADNTNESADRSPLSTLGDAVRTEWDASAAGASAKPRAIKAPPNLYAGLGFVRSPRVTGAAQSDFAEAASGGVADDGVAIRASLASGRALLAFDQLLSAVGYSGTNLLDVTAGYLLRSWELANGESLGPPGSFLAPMRFQLMRAFAAHPGLITADDASQQRLAEYLVYSLSLSSQLHSVLERGGDAESLEQLRQSAAKTALETTGFDLLRCHPGPNGFIPNTGAPKVTGAGPTGDIGEPLR